MPENSAPEAIVADRQRPGQPGSTMFFVIDKAGHHKHHIGIRGIVKTAMGYNETIGQGRPRVQRNLINPLSRADDQWPNKI